MGGVVGGAKSHGGDFDHDPDAMEACCTTSRGEQACLLGVADHGSHDADVHGCGGDDCGSDCCQLPFEELPVTMPKPNPSLAKCGVGFALCVLIEKRQWLVRTDIENSERDRAARKRLERNLVGRRLFRDRWHRFAIEREELGSEQADPFGALLDCDVDVIEVTNVGEKWHEMSVGSGTAPVCASFVRASGGARRQ
jgi:hypothetical protein